MGVTLKLANYAYHTGKVTWQCGGIVLINRRRSIIRCFESSTSCKGARITHLQLCCTTNQHLSQTNSMCRHDVMWPQSNVNSHCHIAEAKTSFLPYKEEDNLLHPCKMSKSSHNRCKQALQNLSLSFSFCHIQMFTSSSKHFLGRDVTRLGLGGGSSPPPPKDVAAPSNWNGNRSSLHGCFGHHAAVS